MSAVGRKRPFIFVIFFYSERLLLSKAVIQIRGLKIGLANGWFGPAISTGRRNTRLKLSILVFGPDGFVGAS